MARSGASFLLKLAVSLVVCQGAGFLGSLFTMARIPTWYASLNRPAIAPPNWVFAPVWITLYLLMGVSACLVWSRGWENRSVRRGLTLFVIQLALNISWSAVFFGLKSPPGGLVVIVLLWAALVLTIASFSRLSKPAAFLLAPYLLWVTFAAVLNASFWLVNR